MGNQSIRHLGVIMDGNRRWARKHMLTSVMRGHEKGTDNFINICTYCQDVGIPYLTVYAFSTENWERSQEEVDGLFKLMERFFVEKSQDCVEKDIRIKMIGDLSRLSPRSYETVRKFEAMTAHCKSILVQVAISYGGRDEIVRAAKKAALDIKNGILLPEQLDEAVFDRYLDTAGVPDVDFVIRTGGNRRLSNFLPWQTVYSEIYFTPILWPDFSREDFDEALRYYESVKINRGK